jgi:hypothetical protein
VITKLDFAFFTGMQLHNHRLVVVVDDFSSDRSKMYAGGRDQGE